MSAPKKNDVFGYPAALILRDAHGEFQVRDAISDAGIGRPQLQWGRITEALRAREADVRGERPKY